MRAPATQSLFEIFNGRIQYVVPIYQRAYVWTEEDNWAPLWDDISDTLERFLHGEEHAKLRHFLGAIVLEQQHFPAGGVDIRLIIDGQQRLTTLQVVLRAASLIAEEHGAADVAKELSDLTLNRAKVATGGLRFKVWPSRRDRAVFQTIVDPSEPAPEPGTKLADAFDFFHARLGEWLTDSESSGEETAQRLEAMRACLDSLLFVVTINLDESDNAQVIFESLNARGADLNALDLSKNALFLQAEREGADLEHLHSGHWEPTFEAEDDTYWQDMQRQGRLNRPRADLFLMHWLTMELGEVVTATRLFEAFRTRILRADPPPEMERFVPRLCIDANIMRSFDSKAAGSAERLFFQRLDAMDTTTLLPLVLLLYREPAIAEGVRARALAALESWLVRRTVLRLTAKNYNRLLASLLAAIKKDLEHADAVVIRELRSSSAVTAVWPSDDVLREQLGYHDLYGRITQARIRMLLEACERDLRHPAKTEPMDLPTGLSIEHVLPQSWEAKWPTSIPDDAPPDVADEAKFQRQARVHRLGNLTLVTGPLNSSLSNEAWEVPDESVADLAEPHDKRSALAAHSLLRLNERLCRSDDWTEAEIDARGKDLTDRILKTWPGPDASVWD